MRKQIIILILLTLLAAAKASSTAGSFMDKPISVKSLSLGGCSATLLDTSAGYKNPALIKYHNRHAVQAMQGQLFNDIGYVNLSYSNPDFNNYKFGLGFAILNTAVSGIEETTYDNTTGAAGITGKKLGYSATAYVFSYSQSNMDNIYYGANFKVIQETLADASSYGAGLDIGLLYKFNAQTLFGLSAINLIKPELKWSTGASDEVNSRISLGGSYQFNEQFQIFTDLENIENRQTYLHFGLEYKPFTAFAFRIGYDKDKITLGTGLEYKEFSLDYAYIDNKDDQLGTNQYLSVALALDLNKTLADLEKQREKERMLYAAITDEQLKKEIAKLAPTNNIVPTESAEIKPLPITPTENVIEELKPEAVASLTPTENPTESITVEPLPQPETTSGNEISIVFEEETGVPIYDYNIALISARYYRKSNKLVCKVYIDNTGNRAETVQCNFKISDGKGNILKAFTPEETKIKVKRTSVLYFTYLSDKPIPAGYYAIEAELKSATITKSQKERFIKRK